MLLAQAMPGTDLDCRFELGRRHADRHRVASTATARLPARDTFAWTVLTALAGDVDSPVGPRRPGLDRAAQAPARIGRCRAQRHPTASRRTGRGRGLRSRSATPTSSRRRCRRVRSTALARPAREARELFAQLARAAEGDPERATDPRRAGRAAPAAGRVPGPPVPQPRRAARRPGPGRDHRADQVGRPVRPRARRRVLDVRDARPSSARSSGTSGTRAGRSACRAGCRSSSSRWPRRPASCRRSTAARRRSASSPRTCR